MIGLVSEPVDLNLHGRDGLADNALPGRLGVEADGPVGVHDPVAHGVGRSCRDSPLCRVVFLDQARIRRACGIAARHNSVCSLIVSRTYLDLAICIAVGRLLLAGDPVDLAGGILCASDRPIIVNDHGRSRGPLFGKGDANCREIHMRNRVIAGKHKGEQHGKDSQTTCLAPLRLVRALCVASSAHNTCRLHCLRKTAVLDAGVRCGCDAGASLVRYSTFKLRFFGSRKTQCLNPPRPFLGIVHPRTTKYD